ncbi:MAG: hypothetical protein QOI95_2012 [Acidimicrobiaceae bacterium]|jgi:fatty-acyl-CoA synthase
MEKGTPINSVPDFVDAVRRHAHYRGSRIAVGDAKGTATFAELVAASDSVAQFLQSRVRPGGRVAIAMTPSAPYLTLVAACLSAGLVAAPVNTRLAPAEARRYLDQLEPAVLVADPTHADWAERLGFETLVVDTVDQRAPLHVRLARLTNRSDARPEPFLRSDEHPALVFGTGGTTGTPKAAVYTHAGLSMNMWCYGIDGLHATTTFELNCTPFFHVALMGPLTTLYYGGRVDVLAQFDPDLVLKAMDEGVTMVGGAAPTVYTMLREHPRFRDTYRDGIAHILYGTTPSTPDFARQLLEDYPRAQVMSGFGATETGLVAFAGRADLDAGRLIGVGRPVPGATVRVVDDNGEEIPNGEIGELATTTPWSAAGYWGNDQETETAWRPEGIRIGDLGTMSADGWLTIVGRRKDMIISGGENVYPSEVEPVLMRYPGIVSAVVFGLPDDQWGERVEATVVTENNQALDVEHLRQWAREHIAPYKVPKRVHVVTELPMTAVMKIDRVRTRELALGDESGVTL